MRTLKARRVLFYATAAFLGYRKYLEAKKERRRKWWVRPMFRCRDQLGFYATTFAGMKRDDPEMFCKATRMNVQQFEMLLGVLELRLTKISLRKPIPAECRLALTLMYLAHGGARYTYALKFKMSTSSVGKIIRETCEAIWEELSSVYLAPPSCSEWMNIAMKFEQKWNFPHCIGAIDGKHVTIVCPPKGASKYYNYKGRHSIVLLAICDGDYCFTMVDVGAYGSQSDGGILANTAFWKLLSHNMLPIPGPSLLPNANEVFPYFFIGDSAFPLRENLMRPYAGNNLTPEEENFNRRLSHARVTIENAFGILAARWRVLRGDIHALPETADKIVKAVVCLHNYLMRTKSASYCPPHYVDSFENGQLTPGQWRNEQEPTCVTSLPPTRYHNASRNNYNLRKKFAIYLQNM